jgi:hypothetical protein
MESSKEPVNLLPFRPFPVVVTPQQRIASLKKALDQEDTLFSAGQKANVETLIRLYEEDKVKEGETVYLMKSQVIPASEFKYCNEFTWIEVSLSYTYLNNFNSS